MLNYSHPTPVYLAQMFDLKEKDINTWNMFGSVRFSVNKSEVSFSEIGADPALEQGNRVVQVVGGIKGIDNNENALSNYFLITAAIRNIGESFCTKFHLDDKEARKKRGTLSADRHRKSRLTENVKKILEVFDTQGINFKTCDEVSNILTKKVFLANIAQNILSIKEIGEQNH